MLYIIFLLFAIALNLLVLCNCFFASQSFLFDVIPLNNAFVFAFYELYHMHGRKRYIIYIQVPQIHTWVILAHTTLRNGCCCQQHCK